MKAIVAKRLPRSFQECSRTPLGAILEEPFDWRAFFSDFSALRAALHSCSGPCGSYGAFGCPKRVTRSCLAHAASSSNRPASARSAQARASVARTFAQLKPPGERAQRASKGIRKREERRERERDRRGGEKRREEERRGEKRRGEKITLVGSSLRACFACSACTLSRLSLRFSSSYAPKPLALPIL